MNRKVTTIALAAALTGGLGATAVPATSASAQTSTTTQAATASARPTLAQAKAQLVALTKTQRLAVVDGVGYSGDRVYFGAVLAGNNTIAFYVNPGDGWAKTSERANLDTPFTDDDTISGYNVQGVQYPVFIARGSYTGNGTGQAIAYGHSQTKGWGVLIGKGRNLIPSGQGAPSVGGMGMELQIGVTTSGILVTHSLWGPQYDESNAEQTSDPIVRTWKGTGKDNLTMIAQRGGPFD